ncbi:MAG: ATP-binding protein [Bacteroidales bacterium]|nr:ATP-binding protein [Bacteroidales bacterium]
MPSRRKSFVSEDLNQQTQTACLNRIYKKVSETGFSAEARDKLKDDIDYVSSFFNIDNYCTVMMAAILEKTNTHNLMDNEDIADFLGCTNIEFIPFHKKLNDMERLGIIQIYGNRIGRKCFRVTAAAQTAIENNEAFVPVKLSGLTPAEFFSRLKKNFKYWWDDIFDDERLIEELDCLVKYNCHLQFCEKALNSSLYTDCSPSERRMFFFLCNCYVNDGEESISIDVLTRFSDCLDIENSIADELLPMQIDGLVNFAIADGMADTNALTLSDEVKSEYFCDVKISQKRAVHHKDLISAQFIQARQLFYNDAEAAQIARLESLLEAENFTNVQSRLLSTGMRKGFNAIFYGAPGTGKTASVYELARKSGRDILLVDMSKLKSKWVGDSEKSVKGLFELYRSLCRSKEKAPILFFNEADAIFSKRFENIEHSVDQMNNSLQNIILEEMEKIDGILIATTNLLTNLDPAFERRFIYKVEFKLPEKESRAKIWKSMITSLSDNDADTLAGRYTFSGGNIENIARKSTVEYVISGNKPTLSTLDSYCREEILNHGNKRTKIGFGQ